jgi:lactate dehydrogenase-like 2-hydroxyacid dehydrogenase
MARVFVTRALPGAALERLSAQHEVEVWPERLPPSAAELRARLAGVDGVISLLSDPLDRTTLDAAPRLRAISNYAVGVDNVDLGAAAERGIPVGHTPDVLTDATADLAFALLLAAARQLVPAAASVSAGEWQTWEPSGFLGAAVAGATLGIVGFGRIGQAVARRAAGFDMRVLQVSRDHAGLDALLAESDFVSLHCPLTPDTRHLIDERALARMKRTAILVNTARGQVVDQAALARALHAGEIAGAALDVTDPEPLPPSDPLLSAPNLIVLPHIGSATYAARERMAELAVDNLLAGLEGRPLPHEARPKASVR